MSDKIKKVTITIELDGTAEEEATLLANAKLAVNAIAAAATLGLTKKLPDFFLLPVGLFAIADIKVICTEPNQQTKSE